MEAESGGVDRILAEAIKASVAPGASPSKLSAELACLLQEKGLPVPNPFLAQMLVSNLCFSDNTACLWKLLEQLMVSRVVSSLQVLALLTQRVIPNRKEQPVAYRLYLELLRRYALDLPSSADPATCTVRILKSIDDALQLSQSHAVKQVEIGNTVVLFMFSVIKILLGCLIEDFGLDAYRNEQLIASGTDVRQGMETDDRGSNEKRSVRVKHRHTTNTIVSVEVLEEMTSNKKVQVFLHLVFINMPEQFNTVQNSMQVIEANKAKTNLSQSKVEKLYANIQRVIMDGNRLGKHSHFSCLFDTRPCNMGTGNSACWIPLDVFMENVMDGRNLHAISVIEALTEGIRTLKVINQASWQETFLALWISALRLVQRGRESLEGQALSHNPRFSMLLAIIPLSIAPLMHGKKSEIDGTQKELALSRRHGLISSLQVLGQFSWLLTAPPALVVAANDAANKAMDTISKMNGGTTNQNLKVVGSMLHLIVEACIARNLIDISVYFRPGYVVSSPKLETEALPNKESPWSSFLEGIPLSNLQNALIATPASSVEHLERLYGLAIDGLEEERLAASSIICGASLTCGWNVQEHAARLVVRLLSPISSPDSLNWTNYVQHMPMLHAILSSISSIDTVHILSLYGLIPELAASLMPICEAFGSMPPPSNHKSCTEKSSAYSVFSYAFLLLFRLWKFYRPPLEHCANARQDLTLEYLLLLQNRQVTLQNSNAQPVCINSFPKLQAWYVQNQMCMSSSTSGLHDRPVQQVVDMILTMIFSKATKSDCNSGTSSGDQHVDVLPLPAWDILEALPFVLEAILEACAHGQLCSRDLTLGLKEIVDLLPASLAIIITYFSAEITRGIWKPVVLNGTEWPSPAANLFLVDQEIKELLASAGVHIPRCYPRGLEPKLPLPMAILVSLTITFNFGGKNLDYIHGLFGQAIENCIGSSPWPSMPIIGALWTLKARRWHDFILLTLSRFPLVHDRDAVSQLICSCFSSFLDPASSRGFHFDANSGAVGLFGNGLIDNGALKHVAPGSLYVHSCRMFLDMHHAGDVIFRLVIDQAHEIAREWASNINLRSAGRTSLAVAVSKMRQVALLAACMLCLAGGLKLVQVLYEELFPTLLLLVGEGKSGTATTSPAGHVGNFLGGYAIAYLLVVSGSFIWGVGETSLLFTLVYSSKRAWVFGKHMEFLARLMEGETLPGCDPGTWKAYVLSFFRLLISLAATWIRDVKVETLRKLASGLRRWNEHELALALLERGGPAAMSAVVESLS
ncbi:Mediator of RNA polymerase II transcription subunit 33A [Rhynchospora pubera]|uniref:Mediator of RNA polymerase II transcription subunit 33A n=1 Tax=Rhynchospora pubera TaxID=906938 RepID=A0AAV8F7J3_9POAL|nr:Mediator of RNA polymerase II transcription subunit 33A [Rhynchospora pubera]